MKAPQFREMKVADLKFAPYNPAGRTSKERVRDLIDSMSHVGLLYPILVTAKGDVIDGHRRLVSARELGWDTIAAVVVDGDPDEMYATVNATSRRMGGNDALTVWLKRPGAVTPLLRSRFEQMVSIVGIRRVERMCKEGFSVKLYQSAMQLSRYVAKEDDVDFICQALDWMLEHRCVGAVKQAMSTGQPAKMIISAVHKDRPLVMKMAVAA